MVSLLSSRMPCFLGEFSQVSESQSAGISPQVTDCLLTDFSRPYRGQSARLIHFSRLFLSQIYSKLVPASMHTLLEEASLPCRTDAGRQQQHQSPIELVSIPRTHASSSRFRPLVMLLSSSRSPLRHSSHHQEKGAGQKAARRRALAPSKISSIGEPRRLFVFSSPPTTFLLGQDS